MAFSHFDVNITEAGRYSKVSLDGVDISKKISSIKITAAVGEATTVELTFLATVAGHIDGELIDITPLDADWREYAPSRT